MLFTLEVLQAEEGDCLLLHWGSVIDPKLAVIDGGPGNVYENTLLPRLKQIAARRKLETLEIDLVMVSHVDNDHITGIRKMFAGMCSDIDNNIPAADRLLKVDRLWHNTFNDILGDGVGAYYETMTASFQASTNGEPNPAIARRVAEGLVARRGLSRDDADFNARAIAEILAGYGDGRDLRNAFEVLHRQNWVKFSLNAPFKHAGRPTLLMAGNTPSAQDIKELQVGIFGPLQADIEALQKSFDEYIKDKGLAAEAVLAACTDTSVPNLSSIVCLASLGKDKQRRSMLFTGDARGDKIMEGLQKGGALETGAMSVNVLKVPHHGSDRNISANFFKTVTADHYVFSANGKYGNPDRETLKWLVEARDKGDEYDIYMTYAISDIDTLRKADFAKNKKRWNDKNDSLASFFAAKSAEGYRFRLHAGTRQLIEIGDEKIAW